MTKKTGEAIKKLTRLGWREYKPEFNWEKFQESLSDAQSIPFYVGDYFLSLTRALSEQQGSPLPIALINSLFNDYDVLQSSQALQSLWSNSWKTRCHEIQADSILIEAEAPVPEGYSPLNASSGEHRSLKKADFWIIHTIAKYLGEPKEVYAKVSSSVSLTYPTHLIDDVIDSLKTQLNLNFAVEDCALNFNILWEDAYLLFNCSSFGVIDYANLYIKSDKSHLIEEALSGKVLQAFSNKVSVGEFRESFPLDSNHEEQTKLTKEMDNFLSTEPSQLNLLLEGQSGTGKTEWVHSYSHRRLAKQGYFIYYLDVKTVQSFSPHPFLPKVTIIVNEVDNLIRDRGDANSSLGLTEVLLSFLEGSSYQSISDDNSADVDQQVVFLMTCNTKSRLDPALERRVVHRTFENTYDDAFAENKIKRVLEGEEQLIHEKKLRKEKTNQLRIRDDEGLVNLLGLS